VRALARQLKRAIDGESGLMKSLTRDRGLEMAGHKDFTITT
jgi:IS30 family transposase